MRSSRAPPGTAGQIPRSARYHGHAATVPAISGRRLTLETGDQGAGLLMERSIREHLNGIVERASLKPTWWPSNPSPHPSGVHRTGVPSASSGEGLKPMAVDARLAEFKAERTVQTVGCLPFRTGCQLDEVQPEPLGGLQQGDDELDSDVVATGGRIDGHLLNESELSGERRADTEQRHACDAPIELRDNHLGPTLTTPPNRCDSE